MLKNILFSFKKSRKHTILQAKGGKSPLLLTPVDAHSPYYFSKNTLKFFGQTITGFKLKRMEDGRIRMTQKTKHGTESVRFFNPQNDKLEHY